MEIRQNIYFILLYTIIIGFILISSTLLYVRIMQMNENIKIYESVEDIVSNSYMSYLSGNYYTYQDPLISRHRCYTQYGGSDKIYIICDNQQIPFLSLRIPILMDIKRGTDKIYVERGSIDYGVFRYFYVLVTTKSLLIIRTDIENPTLENEKFSALVNNLFYTIPLSKIIGFYDSDSYLIICQRENVKDCDKSDFLATYFLYESLEDFLLDLKETGGIDSNSNDVRNMKEYLSNMYDYINPQFIAIVDNKNKCQEHEDCIVFSPNKIKYVYKTDNKNIFSQEVVDSYDLTLLIFFKNFYGSYDGKYFELVLEGSYREKWKDMLKFYARILSIRYDMLSSNIQYEYPSYESCREWFNELSQLFCINERSLCTLANENPSDIERRIEHIKSLNELLIEIKEISKKIITNGCEERVFL